MSKKSYLSISAILIFLSFLATSYAAPSITGGRGLFLVEDARSEDVGVFAVSTYLLAHKVTSNSYAGDVTLPHILYSPTSFLDVFFWTGQLITHSNIKYPKLWESEMTTAKHDMVAGVKISSPTPYAKIGAKLTYSWPRSTDSIYSIKKTDGFHWLGLLTLNFSSLHSSAPDLLINYTENSSLRKYGAGLEISGTGGALFVEAASQEPKSVPMFKSIMDNITVTPGLRLIFNDYSNLSGGVIMDVKKKPEIPDYTVIVGLTAGGAILIPKKPVFSIITGTVTDVVTGQALKATISFPGQARLKPVMSSSQTGIYKAEKIKTGILAMEVVCDGYQKQTASVVIQANRITGYDFKLKPLVSYGVVAGNVYDEQTKKPIEAVIKFSDDKLPQITSDLITGSFKLEQVRTGVVTIEANKENYFPQAVTVSVEQGKVSQANFPMVSSIYRGYFIGRVLNKADASPVRAVITFPNTNLSRIETDSITGTFQTELPVGTYPVLVTADSFLTQSGIITIEKDHTTESRFELVSTGIKTVMTGKVSDKKTGQGLRAVISFPEVNIQAVATDSLTGIFRAEIPVGSYLAEVKSYDYLTQTAMVILEPDKALEKNFELVKTGMILTLKGVYFEIGKATLKPESYATLQEASLMLKDNPAIKVEIQGHTDNTGSASLNQKLSDERAYAAMNYLVQNLGVNASRLTAKGFGETKPIASNSNTEGRALNRRVDFVIKE